MELLLNLLNQHYFIEDNESKSAETNRICPIASADHYFLIKFPEEVQG